jgi:hypothetical protein
VNVTLIGGTYEDFFVRDQDGFPLDYKIDEGYARVHKLILIKQLRK